MRFETLIKLSVVLLPVKSVAPALAQTDRDDGPTLRVLSSRPAMRSSRDV
jgi:hypothetical protein